MKKANLLISVMQDKCPNCRDGYVFSQKTGVFNLPVMFEDCNKCNYHFDREPGYFLGAMYISYGLATLQGIITFFICHYFFPDLSTWWEVFFVLIVLILFGKKNYKASRILYIHIFPW